MCRNVIDIAQVLSVIAGYDEEDVNSVNAPAIDYAASLGRRIAVLRVGVASALVSKITDPEIKAAIDAAVAVMRTAATRVREVELPAIPEETLGNVLLPEAYVTHDPLLRAAADFYHPVIRQRAEFGRTIDAIRYITARRDLERLRRAVARVFLDVDVVLAPTAYATAPTIEQNAKEEEGGGPPPVLPTADFSIYGLPTISVPCGFTGSGLPIGLQIAGPRLGDAKVLAMAWAYERATEWHTRTSPI
jgi:aspartyl-tRNA(Asn)/glutamyl-tRNA(Gln) amidotransferase subunit A